TTTPCGPIIPSTEATTSTPRSDDVTTPRPPCNGQPKSTTPGPNDVTTPRPPCNGESKSTTPGPNDVPTPRPPCNGESKSTTPGPNDETTPRPPCNGQSKPTTPSPDDVTTPRPPCKGTTPAPPTPPPPPPCTETTTTACRPPTTPPCTAETSRIQKSTSEGLINLIPKPLRNLFASTSNSPVGSSAMCVGRAEGSLVRDPNHCRRFYECREGRRLLRKCRAGLWFDSEAGECRARSLVLNCPAQRN
ncbi:hypothetical protein KR067_004864, partial [Drosophila pandora]